MPASLESTSIHVPNPASMACTHRAYSSQETIKQNISFTAGHREHVLTHFVVIICKSCSLRMPVVGCVDAPHVPNFHPQRGLSEKSLIEMVQCGLPVFFGK